MRLVGVLANPDLATTFGDYLHSLGISARVDQTTVQPSLWEIWVRDEDQVARSKSELDRFVANPRANEFLAAASSTGTATVARETPAPILRTRARAAYEDRVEHHPLVTLGLGVMCLAVALAIPFPTKDADEYAKLRQWSLYNQLLYEPAAIGVSPQQQPPPFSAIRAGEVWRLFTPALMHANWTHLLMNLSGLISLGILIERRDGSLRLLLLTLFIAAVAHTAQYAVGLYQSERFPGNFLGISGVVFGLFGYAWVRSFAARPHDHWDGVVTSQQVYFILAFGLVCTTGLLGPIANTAHFAGMFAGMLWAWIVQLLQKQKRIA